MFRFGARAAQGDESALHALGDFTANAHLLLLSSVAILIGIISAYVAVALLALINFFTNLFFYQRFSIAAASPAAHMVGGFVREPWMQSIGGSGCSRCDWAREDPLERFGVRASSLPESDCTLSSNAPGLWSHGC